MFSPYFSPGKTGFCSAPIDWDPASPNHQRKEDKHVEQAAEHPDNQLMLNDPLLHFYIRRFFDLYQQLSLLKPNLVQEAVASDPWKLLVAVTLLNKTTGKVAIPIFWELMKKWPSPWAMSQADQVELRDYIRCLGTYDIRSRRLIEMSMAYIRDPPRECDARPSRPVPHAKHMFVAAVHRRQGRYPPTPVSHLPGTGPYALDSYRIFCASYNNLFCEEWKVVLPTDKELVLYLRWKWAYEERKEWSPFTGRVTPADIPFLESLVEELIKYHACQRQYK